MVIATSAVSVININDGKDSTQLYTWIVYANSNTPEPNQIYSSSEGMKYVGFAYNKTTEEYSTDYHDYQWVALDGHIISNMKYVYHSSTSTNAEDISMPFKSYDLLLHVNEGYIHVTDGYIKIFNQNNDWSYDKPDFVYGQHLWVSTEILTNDGKYIYSEPTLSSEWEVYYDMKIGGRQLIRNSKTLLDERIYWI